jgi:hypothetical protein
MDIEATLGERQKTYGDYSDVAHRSQIIKAAFRASPKWSLLASCQRESLEMIANKLARILEGNCNHIDSWHDIAGYSQLVVKYLEPQVDD